MKRHWTAVAEDVSEANSLADLALLESQEGPLSPAVAERFAAKALGLMPSASVEAIAEALSVTQEDSILAPILRGEHRETSEAVVPATAPASVTEDGSTDSTMPLPPPPPTHGLPRPRRIAGRIVRVRGEDGVVRVVGLGSLRHSKR